jgi:MFS transporter, DHA1 family, tetracycline resistance protein
MNRRKPLAVIFQTIFLDLLGFGIVLPLLPLYAERFGATPLLITSISASYSLMQFIFVPFWGRLSDRIGRRPILLLSIGGACAAYIFMGLTRSLAGLIIARVFSGIAGANLSVAQAYIADVTKPEERAKGMGLVGAAFGLGFIFGPAIGGLLSTLPHSVLPRALWGWEQSLPFFAAAFLAALNLLLAFRWLPESRTAGSTTGAGVRPPLTLAALLRALSTPRLGWLLAIVFVSTFAFANMESTFVLWGKHSIGMDSRTAGWLFAFIGVLLVAMQGGLIGKLTRRFGEQRLVVIGTLATANGLLLVPLCTSIPPLLPALALLSLGSGMSGPALQSLISRGTTADDQGGVLGINQSLASLARVTGPVWAGFAFGRFGHSAPWLTGGVLMAIVCGASAVVLLSKRMAHTEPEPSKG